MGVQGRDTDVATVCRAMRLLEQGVAKAEIARRLVISRKVVRRIAEETRRR